MFAISREAGGDDRWQQGRSRSENRAENSAARSALPPKARQAAASAPGLRSRSEFQQLLAYAIKMLARREHSTVELRRKLSTYNAGNADSDSRQTEEHINQVIDALLLDGSLSDERFTSEYVRLRINKGYGPIRIRMDLLERGIPDRLAEESLTRPAEFWQTLAADVCARKFGHTVYTEGGADAGHPDQAESPLEPLAGGQRVEADEQRQRRAQQRWNRCARFLSQRGFPADLIYQTLEGRLVD